MKHSRIAIPAIACALCVTSWSADAAEDSSALIGTWAIRDFSVLFLDTNESVRTMGEHPIGYIQYAQGGHMVVFLAGEGRKPLGRGPNDAEAANFYRTIIAAYAGTYTVEGNKIVHHVASAWTPEWNGTDQIRYFDIAGNTLTIRTAPLKSPLTGRQIITTNVFERVE